VAVVLGDALRRISVLGGRVGVHRSLGSVLGGSVSRFLRCGIAPRPRRRIACPGVSSNCNGVAVAVDGAVLLVSDSVAGTDSVHMYSVADGAPLGVVGGRGTGACEFCAPCQITVALDGSVFIADTGNDRVQELAPDLTFRRFIGVGELSTPRGACASATLVVVSEGLACDVAVFRRADGGLLRRFGRKGSGPGQLMFPCAVSFLPCERLVAVADSYNNRVSVFSVHGIWLCNIGVGVLKLPAGVACSSDGEMLVGDVGNVCMRLFNYSGTLVQTVGYGCFTGVAIFGNDVYAQDAAIESLECAVFRFD
jgi:hypothetical protein